MIRMTLPMISFAALMLATGVMHGLHTDRWRPSADIEDAVRRLDALPQSLGEWRGRPAPLDEQEVKQGGIKGYRSYHYGNVITGDKVSLLIVCGRPGPISVHTPDICYGGAGFEAVGRAAKKEVSVGPGRTVPVWSMRFKSPPTLASSQIEVSWVWNAGQGWFAPENPRWEFARCPILYKLYVVRELPAKPDARDPSVSFMQAFLPELETLLRPSPKS